MNDELPEQTNQPVGSPEGKMHFPQWKDLKKSPELIAILIDAVVFSLLVGEIMYLRFMRDGMLFRHIWTIIGVHITGGTALGVLQAAKNPYLLIWDNIVFNGLLACFLVFSFSSLFSLSCKGLFHIPCLKNFFIKAEIGAQGQRRAWIRFGIPGIFLFVLFPLPGTGPNIGFVLGKLMGINFYVNLLTVSSACLTVVVSFAFLGDRLYEKMGSNAINHMMIFFIVILIGCALVGKMLALRKRRKTPIGEKTVEVPPDEQTR